MVRDKISTIRALIKSKVFVLVTDRETFVYADIKGLTAVLQLSALKMLVGNLTETIEEIEKKMEDTNGG